MTKFREAAARCPQHNGCTQRIRETLAAAPGPMSIDGLWCALGMSYTKAQVTRALGQLLTRGGFIVSTRSPRGPVYGLFRPGSPAPASPKSSKGSGQIAEPITIGRGSVWGYRVAGQLA